MLLLGEIDALRADLAAAREREARLRETLAELWQRPVGDAGWYCLRCGWGNQHNPSCILATPAPPEPQPASSEATVPVVQLTNLARGSLLAEPTPAVGGDVEPAYIKRGVSDFFGTRQRYATCTDCGWLTYTDSPTIVDHTDDCPHSMRHQQPAASAPSGEASSDA